MAHRLLSISAAAGMISFRARIGGGRDLPSDLIPVVASYLDSPADLLSLSLVCKRFHSLLLQPRRDDKNKLVSQGFIERFKREVYELVDSQKGGFIWLYYVLPSGHKHGPQKEWNINKRIFDLILKELELFESGTEPKPDRRYIITAPEAQVIIKEVIQDQTMSLVSDCYRYLNKLNGVARSYYYANRPPTTRTETWYESEEDIPRFDDGPEDRKTTMKKEYSEAGEVVFQKTFLHNTGDTLYEFWSPSGVKEREYTTKDGKMHGRERAFHTKKGSSRGLTSSNKRVRYVIDWQDGKRDGKAKFYNQDGSMTVEQYNTVDNNTKLITERGVQKVRQLSEERTGSPILFVCDANVKLSPILEKEVSSLSTADCKAADQILTGQIRHMQSVLLTTKEAGGQHYALSIGWARKTHENHDADAAGRALANQNRDEFVEQIWKTFGIVLVYSVANRASFEAIPEIWKQICDVRGTDIVPVILVATDSEGSNDHVVLLEEGMEQARKMKGCSFLQYKAPQPNEPPQLLKSIASTILVMHDAASKEGDEKACVLS